MIRFGSTDLQVGVSDGRPLGDPIMSIGGKGVVSAPMRAGSKPASGSLISRKRISGKSGSANASALTGVQVLRAPAAFDSVRLILHINQATLPGSNVKISIAPSAKAGYNPVTAANAAVAFTTVTWAGATSIAVANAAASADGGVVESEYVSDLMPVASLDRADTPGLPPLIHARIYASSYVPLYTNVGKGPDAVTEPDYIAGTVSGDQTAAVLGSAPINTTYDIPITWEFYNRGVRVITIGTPGDSTMMGSHSSAGTAVDGSEGQYNGFPRQLKDALVAAGIPASIEQMCYHGEPSTNFHELAKNALNNLNGIGLTHLMFYLCSVNDASRNSTTWAAAQARVRAIIDLCVAKGVVPILVRNPPGYEPAEYQALTYNAFLDTIALEGKAIVYDMRPPVGLAASGYPVMPDAYRLHDSGGAVITADKHPNNLFHATIAADMFAKRVALKMAAS